MLNLLTGVQYFAVSTAFSNTGVGTFTSSIGTVTRPTGSSVTLGGVTVPEGGSVALVGMGILPLVGIVMRRRNKQS
ncbi:MAG: PEP-CTERM sorting domain-containing protein [Cytophagaceae bacterium]|nr:MAG: PEP-CTERM sorting domain-containing protein [Cytophagaceae bacterium]